MSREATAGRWTQHEHDTFVKGLNLYNKQWKLIADLIKTRTVVQVRTHAQKYFLKLVKHGDSSYSQHDDGMGGDDDEYTGSGGSKRKGGSSFVLRGIKKRRLSESHASTDEEDEDEFETGSSSSELSYSRKGSIDCEYFDHDHPLQVHHSSSSLSSSSSSSSNSLSTYAVSGRPRRENAGNRLRSLSGLGLVNPSPKSIVEGVDSPRLLSLANKKSSTVPIAGSPLISSVSLDHRKGRRPSQLSSNTTHDSSTTMSFGPYHNQPPPMHPLSHRWGGNNGLSLDLAQGLNFPCPSDPLEEEMALTDWFDLDNNHHHNHHNNNNQNNAPAVTTVESSVVGLDQTSNHRVSGSSDILPHYTSMLSSSTSGSCAALSAGEGALPVHPSQFLSSHDDNDDDIKLPYPPAVARSSSYQSQSLLPLLSLSHGSRVPSSVDFTDPFGVGSCELGNDLAALDLHWMAAESMGNHTNGSVNGGFNGGEHGGVNGGVNSGVNADASCMKVSSSMMGVPPMMGVSSMMGPPMDRCCGGLTLQPTQPTASQGVSGGGCTNTSLPMSTVSLRFPMGPTMGSTNCTEEGVVSLSSLAFLGNDEAYSFNSFKPANAVDRDVTTLHAAAAADFYTSKSSSSSSMASLVSSSSSSSPETCSWAQSSGKCHDDAGSYAFPHDDVLPHNDDMVMYGTAPSFFKTISNAIMKTMVDNGQMEKNVPIDMDVHDVADERKVTHGLGMGLQYVAADKDTEEDADDEDVDGDDDGVDDTDGCEDDAEDDADADLIKILSEDDHDEEQQQFHNNRRLTEMKESALMTCDMVDDLICLDEDSVVSGIVEAFAE